jgi:hypothetical protein
MALVTTERFSKISLENTNEPASQVKGSLAIFKDCLYLAVISYDDHKYQDYRRILRYEPTTGSWVEVYKTQIANQKENTTSLNSLKVDSEGEFSNENTVNTHGASHQISSELVVFKGQTDASPTLYVSMLSPASSQFLHSEDGKTFNIVSEIRLENSSSLSLNKFLVFQDQLYALSGVATGDKSTNETETALIYVSDSPSVRERWQKANLPGFGDQNNQAISEVSVFNNCLYAATVNPLRGFQIWKTQANGQTPYVWEQVLVDGAYWHTLNQLVSSMVVFKDNLYIASRPFVFGHNEVNNFYPPASELIRIYPDNSWDLIVGTPRFTPNGLKVPLSGKGSGFDNPYDSTFQCLAVHNGYLYAGTRSEDSFQLWTSEDGQTWEPISLENLGNHFRIALLNAMSTPLGLVLVANTKSYEDKDYRLEIWLGK